MLACDASFELTLVLKMVEMSENCCCGSLICSLAYFPIYISSSICDAQLRGNRKELQYATVCIIVLDVTCVALFLCLLLCVSTTVIVFLPSEMGKL